MAYRLVISKPIAAKQGGFDWSTFAEKSYTIQSASFTWSWGSEPGTANINYIGASDPTPVNSTVKVELGPYTFYGTCQTDRLLTSTSGGIVRQMQFTDFRDWMEGDTILGYFNKPDTIFENGERIRRYRHLLPANALSNYETWTNLPYSAAQIIQFLLSAPTVEVPWTIGSIIATTGLPVAAFHDSQLAPIYDFDCQNGMTLRQAFVELSQRQGLLFTHYPVTNKPFNIVFARKGIDGPDVAMPANSDEREEGLALSGAPTRVMIVGDRNHYQIQNVDLIRSWAPAWEQFYDFDLFVQDIYTRTAHAGGDPEHIITYQTALANALDMTVGEYADLVGSAFSDWRLFAGRSRMSMPVKLYIEQVLFRCFQVPPNFWIFNTYGQRLYINSSQMAELVAKVTHDPVTGYMYWDETEIPDGPAYAIVQGYQLGKDLFESIRPDRFNLSAWNNAQNIWQSCPCRVDDSGERDGKLIVFDEPVIQSSSLVDIVDGLACYKAIPTFVVPAVRAAFAIRGESFRWTQSVVMSPGDNPDVLAAATMKDHVENVGGLYGEFVRDGALTEIRYGDGQTCRYKAIVNANVLLQSQFKIATGQFTEPVLTTGPTRKLHGKIDRLLLDFNTSSFKLTVGLTKEMGQRWMLPERALDRQSRLNQLFPGQQQLRKDSQTALKIAAAARSSKDAYNLLGNSFRGEFGKGGKTDAFNRLPSGGASQNVGAPFHVRTGATLVQPTKDDLGAQAAGQAQVRFVGITVRNGEPSSNAVPLKVPLVTGGPCFARVRGPIQPGDSVYFSYGVDYLMTATEAATNDWSYPVGISDAVVATGVTALVQIKLGTSSPGNNEQKMLVTSAILTLGVPTLLCSRYGPDGTTLVETNVEVALPFKLRTAPNPNVSIQPEYAVNDRIYCIKPIGGTGATSAGSQIWLDMNVDSRKWCLSLPFCISGTSLNFYVPAIPAP